MANVIWRSLVTLTRSTEVFELVGNKTLSREQKFKMQERERERIAKAEFLGRQKEMG